MTTENNLLDLDIRYECEDWPRDEALYRDIIVRALPERNSRYEVSLVLADDAFIRPLNRDFRSKDKATNVLSFPQGHEAMLGDLVLAYETIAHEATEQGKAFQDHLAHMLIHGTLHLLGYDHETDEDAAKMEALEVETLAGMGIKNPYETP